MLCSSYRKKIVTKDEAESLSHAGLRSADLHVHTNCSYDILPAPSLSPEALYKKGREQGLDYITFTDHDTVEAYDRMGWEREGLVPGVEMKLKDMKVVGHTIHINIYTLNKKQFEELYEIAHKQCCLESFVDYCNENGLPFTYNHPFWNEPDEKPNIGAIFEIAKLFPVLEYNMHRVWRKNRLTFELARKFKRGLVATTDTHIGDIGEAFTLAKGETFKEFFNNIKKGSAYLFAKDLTVSNLLKEINKWFGILSREKVLPVDKSLVTTAHVDKLIKSYYASRAKFPLLTRGIQNFIYCFANTAIPAFVYVLLQNAHAMKINNICSRRSVRISA